MHIFLLVLKILLIVVLSVLGLAIALALLVLLVPVRYKAYVQKQDSVLAKASATWLGFVVCFKASYDDERLVYRLRLLGGTIIDSEKTDDEEEKEGAEEPEKTVKPRKPRKQEKKTEAEFASLDGDDADFYTDESEFETKNNGFFAKLGRRLDALAKGITDKLDGISKKLSGLKDKKNGYTKLYKNARTKEAISVVKRQLVLLLRHIKPVKLKGQVIYGAGDPADTGQHLGYMSLLFPLYYDHIDITPDFEEKRLEGDLFMAGRIRLCVVCLSVLKVILNKNCRITYERFKKI